VKILEPYSINSDNLNHHIVEKVDFMGLRHSENREKAFK
jgi:hypothetical protein